MRKQVQVLGVGSRMSGVSKKSGKPFDFTEVAISYECQGFTGCKCETVAIESDMLNGRSVAPGDTLDLIFHQANFKTYVDAVL